MKRAERVERLREDAAIRRSVSFLTERLRNRRCDAEAVSDCERCNVWYLLNIIDRAGELQIDNLLHSRWAVDELTRESEALGLYEENK